MGDRLVHRPADPAVDLRVLEAIFGAEVVDQAQRIARGEPDPDRSRAEVIVSLGGLDAAYLRVRRPPRGTSQRHWVRRIPMFVRPRQAGPRNCASSGISPSGPTPK